MFDRKALINISSMFMSLQFNKLEVTLIKATLILINKTSILTLLHEIEMLAKTKCNPQEEANPNRDDGRRTLETAQPTVM